MLECVQLQSKLLVISAVAATMVGGACGTTAASPSPKPAVGTTIAVVTNPKIGMILVDGRGRTLYLFVADRGAVSTCYDSCAAIWPPVLTTVAPRPGDGAQPNLLGTTIRTDGKTEVTYAGHPLYYFAQDKKAGDTKGQGVDGFGALWWAVSPAGTAVHQVST